MFNTQEEIEMIMSNPKLHVSHIDMVNPNVLRICYKHVAELQKPNPKHCFIYNAWICSQARIYLGELFIMKMTIFNWESS